MSGLVQSKLPLVLFSGYSCFFPPHLNRLTIHWHSWAFCVQHMVRKLTLNPTDIFTVWWSRGVWRPVVHVACKFSLCHYDLPQLSICRLDHRYSKIGHCRLSKLPDNYRQKKECNPPKWYWTTVGMERQVVHQETKIFQYCTCHAGRVTYNFHLSCKHMHLSFKSVCN